MTCLQWYGDYFALGIPQDEVPDALVRRALAGIVTGEDVSSLDEFATISQWR